MSEGLPCDYLWVDWLVNWWHGLFWTQAWGNAAEWFGAIGTGGAFIAAVVFFIHERRTANRGQASLVFVRKVKGAYVEITNRSDKSIFDVRTVVDPMSMMTALTIGEVNQTPAMGVGGSNTYKYPSHEYYLLMRRLLKEKARRFSANSPNQGDVEIPAGEKHEIFVPELMFNLDEAYVLFLDAYGRSWAVNVG